MISTFINQSYDQSRGVLSFLQDWGIQTERLRQKGSKRIQHVHPQVLAAFADHLNMTQDAFSKAVVDPFQADPFEVLDVTFAHPNTFLCGRETAWSWALLPTKHHADTDDEKDTLWLLFWNDHDWYYAPFHTTEQQSLISSALPELSSVKPPRAIPCLSFFEDE